MYRYVHLCIPIEKIKDESDEKTEQRLREQLVKKGFNICYPTIETINNYNC